MNEIKKLTVVKTTYGSNKFPVIMLNFHDGANIPTGEILSNKIPLEIITMIAKASQAGYVIDYKGFED
jgi:TolB-like protein